MENQPTKRRILVEAELVIPQEAVVKSMADPERRVTEEEIRVLGASPLKAKIFLQQIEDPVKALDLRKQEIPQGLTAELAKGSYAKFVGLGCGFLDSPDCHVTWARLGLKLQVVPVDQSSSARILHVFPRHVTEPVTISRRRSLDATLGLEVAQAFKLGPSFGVSQSEETIIYQPTIVSYVNNAEAYWTFEAPARSWIAGDQDVFFIAKFPGFGRLQAQFVLGLEARSKWGNIWPFKVKDPDAIQAFYDLDALI